MKRQEEAKTLARRDEILKIFTNHPESFGSILRQIKDRFSFRSRQSDDLLFASRVETSRFWSGDTKRIYTTR